MWHLELWCDFMDASFWKKSLQKRIKKVNFRAYPFKSDIISRWFMEQCFTKFEIFDQANVRKKPFKKDFSSIGIKEQLVFWGDLRCKFIENEWNCKETLQLLSLESFGISNWVLFNIFEDNSVRTFINYEII